LILSDDSKAIILLCSNFIIANKIPDAPKPFTLKEWDILSRKLKDSLLLRPSAFFKTTPDEWRRHLNLTDIQVERIQRLLAQGGQLAVEMNRLESLGIWVTTRAEPNYPTKLKKTLRFKSPVVLYGAGDLSIVNTDSIAIVGSRDVDEVGAEFTRKLAIKCALEHLIIVSGGSRGVDMEAQNAAISMGGNVVAVLSDGLESKIRQRDIRNSITSGNLVLISAWHPKARFTAYSAMERNKHIYALSKFAVVVSSAENKGGTWGGATENLKAGWVPLFVRSGLNTPPGNSRLIELGGNSINNEVVMDKNTRLIDWFDENQQKLSKRKPTNNDEKIIDRNTQVKLNFENTDSSIEKFSSKNPHLYDLFYISWLYLKQALVIPQTEEDLARLFNINVYQVRDWLRRAVKDNKVRKLLNENKYVLAVYNNSKNYGDG